MTNRLKLIRENFLRVTLEEFSTKVGITSGNPDKWYPQRVSRIEHGETRLNDQMIRQICDAYPELTPGDFFGESILSPDEKKIIENFRGLADGQKQMFSHMLESFSAGETPKKQENDFEHEKTSKK